MNTPPIHPPQPELTETTTDKKESLVQTETPKTFRNPLEGMSNLQQRVIAGFIGAFVLVGSILLSEWTYFALFFVICLFAQYEFYNLLIADKKKPNKLFGSVIGSFVFILVFLIERFSLDAKFYLTLFPLSAFVFIYELYNNKKKPFNNVAFTLLGVLYVAIPFSVMNVSAFIHGRYSWQTVIGVLLLLWGSDTGAYFAGRAFGKTKLFERVSPKKTWEGTMGGAALSMLTAIVISYWFTEWAMWHWMFLSSIIVIFGNFGDLVESSFKRSLAIKDSGTFIPGHGGFLDRFDGLLLANPFVCVFLILVS